MSTEAAQKLAILERTLERKQEFPGRLRVTIGEYKNEYKDEPERFIGKIERKCIRSLYLYEKNYTVDAIDESNRKV